MAYSNLDEKIINEQLAPPQNQVYLNPISFNPTVTVYNPITTPL